MSVYNAEVYRLAPQKEHREFKQLPETLSLKYFFTYVETDSETCNLKIPLMSLMSISSPTESAWLVDEIVDSSLILIFPFLNEFFEWLTASFLYFLE